MFRKLNFFNIFFTPQWYLETQKGRRMKMKSSKVANYHKAGKYFAFSMDYGTYKTRNYICFVNKENSIF